MTERKTSPSSQSVTTTKSCHSSGVRKLASVQPLDDLLSRPAQRRSIINPSDDRLAATDTTAPPWCWICRLAIHHPPRRPSPGTGWLIGPRTLITAAHNVHHTSLGPAHHIVVEVPGRRAGETVRTESRVFETHPAWPGSFDPAVDIACIRLPVDVPGWAPWCELSDPVVADPTDAGAIGMLVTVAGWTEVPVRPASDEPRSEAVDSEAAESGLPGPNAARLMKATDVTTALLSERLFYLTDTTAGQSGSPVWVDGRDGRPVVIGVHTYNVNQTPTDMPRANSATRLTQKTIALIERWRATA